MFVVVLLVSTKDHYIIDINHHKFANIILETSIHDALEKVEGIGKPRA
jgi:hypothetical protein